MGIIQRIELVEGKTDMRLKWSPAIVLGIKEIDLQHQQLIELINNLEDSLSAGNVATSLDKALPELMAYVLFHFQTEEQLMESSELASSHFLAHKREHQIFAERVQTLKTTPPTPAILDDFVQYLKSWLIRHIMGTDRQLVEVLRGKQP